MKTSSLYLALAVTALAADNADWSRVQVLKAGDRVGVVSMDKKRVEGALAGATDSAIVIHAGSDVTVTKDNVVRVYRRPRLSRGIRALIGAAVGAGVGGIIYGTSGQSIEEGAFCCGAAAGITIAGSAGAGAAVGSLTGGGYETVYRKP